MKTNAVILSKHIIKSALMQRRCHVIPTFIQDNEISCILICGVCKTDGARGDKTLIQERYT